MLKYWGYLFFLIYRLDVFLLVSTGKILPFTRLFKNNSKYDEINKAVDIAIKDTNYGLSLIRAEAALDTLLVLVFWSMLNVFLHLFGVIYHFDSIIAIFGLFALAAFFNRFLFFRKKRYQLYFAAFEKESRLFKVNFVIGSVLSLALGFLLFLQTFRFQPL